MEEVDSMVDTNVPGGDLDSVKELRAGYDRIRKELATVIVGQDEVVEQLLIALFANGHCLLEGVPGLAKTMMISTLARCLALSFNRIQFTPDLMPSDITGTDVIQDDKATGTRAFRFLKGAIFANVILADEINRTPPKTQAALLEAMQERQVSVGGERHVLAKPFFVLATQNPIEQEGTYSLPEAQQDRFLFKVFVTYPSYEQEYEIAERTTTALDDSVTQVFTGEQIVRQQELVRRIPAAPDVIRHALDLVRATRPQEAGAPEFIKKMLTWGAGPRAVQALILGGKARAALYGRCHLSVDDVRALAKPVLRHRIVTNYTARAGNYDADRVIDDLLSAVVPGSVAALADDRVKRVLAS
jgi:MoxR-like ATPase